MGLSVRCTQPIQQQGRRLPLIISLTVLSTCSRRVSGFLTNSIQQIHSLRARGVKLSQAVRAVGLASRAFFKSLGKVWTTPAETVWAELIISILYQIAWNDQVDSICYNGDMSKNPFINALAASGYIFLIVSVLAYVSETLGDKPDTFFAPIAFLSLLTLSVVVMAFLFFYQPLQLFIEGKKKQALNLFAQTAGVFAVLTVFISILVFSGLI